MYSNNKKLCTFTFRPQKKRDELFGWHWQTGVKRSDAQWPLDSRPMSIFVYISFTYYVRTSHSDIMPYEWSVRILNQNQQVKFDSHARKNSPILKWISTSAVSVSCSSWHGVDSVRLHLKRNALTLDSCHISSQRDHFGASFAMKHVSVI